MRAFHRLCLSLPWLGAAGAAQAADLDGAALSAWWGLPFAGMLLSIAIMPLAIPKVWHHHFGKIAAGWALLLLLPFAATQGLGITGGVLVHTLVAEYIPFIVLLTVMRRNGVCYTRQPADDKHRNKPEGEEHWSTHAERTAPDGAQPVKYLHTGRHGDEHCRHRERSDTHRSKSRREHVVGPHAKAHEPNGSSRKDHEAVAKQRLAAERREDLRDDAHGWQNQDIDLGMAKYPE